MSDKNLRFAFGKNWTQFLKHLNENRILEAEKSLQQKLNLKTLKGKTFLDIGCGSGLFSLAAHRLGATVHSFDYDENSVSCAKYLKEKFASNAKNWTIEQGSILDKQFLKQFKNIDIVYSWGVLHHTGNMYKAFENIAQLVNSNGHLFISIYNDQGRTSKIWTWIKKKYNSTNKYGRAILVSLVFIRIWGLISIRDFFTSGNPFRAWMNYGKNDRGMSPWHDLIDWVGGYPFEVAKPEEVFSYFYEKGFQLTNLKTCAGGLGCNEFVFVHSTHVQN